MLWATILEILLNILEILALIGSVTTFFVIMPNKFRKKNIDNIFCEIESPMFSTESVKKYLYFWKKNNFKHIDFKYIQPALASGKNAVKGLWLVVLTEQMEKTVDTALLKDILYDYLKYCMQIDNPELNADYAEMMQDLEGKERVGISSIIE